MKAIYLNVEDNIYQKVIDFLKLFPKNKIEVVEDISRREELRREPVGK